MLRRVVLLVLALLAPLLAVGVLDAADAREAATARITGRVTATDGSPASAYVYAYRRSSGPGGWTFAADAETGSDGRYELSGLTPDTYRLQFDPDYGGDLVPEYWNNAESLADATDVVVADGATVGGRNAVLAPSARITGLVRDAAGGPAAQVQVVAYRPDPTGTWRLVAAAASGPDGRYTLQQLRAGSYRVGFRNGFGQTSHLPEFWDDARDLAGATTIAVATGATVPGINARLADGGSLEGTVTTRSGAPLQGVYVTAYSSTADGQVSYGNASTDATGHYRIVGLQPGSYDVFFQRSGYVGEYWDDQQSQYDANLVTVTAGATAGGIDAELAAGAHLTGRVSDEVSGAALAGVRVQAWVKLYRYWGPAGTVVTGPDGTYDLSQLRGGTYRLEFTDTSGAHVSEVFPDRPTLATGGDIALADEATVHKFVALTPAGQVTGRVLGTTADGPLRYVSVAVYGYDTTRSLWRRLTSGQTDEQGRYTVAGLPAGTYRVGFEAYSSSYLDEFWSDAATVDVATDVVVGSSGATALGDTRLVQGGRIAGTVTGPGGRPLQYAGVTAYRLVDDDRGRGYRDLNQTSTDADGHYELDRLPPGRYRIGFRSYEPKAGVVEEYWDDAATVETATDVVVRGRQSVEGIDAELAVGGRLSGTVAGPDGAPLGDISVTAYRQRGGRFTSYRGAYTDARGRYEIGNLPTGTYRLGFADASDSEFAPEFSDDQPDLDSAEDLAVTAGRVVRRNAQLSPSAHITGRLTAPDGSPIWSATVYPYSLDPETGRWQRLPGGDEQSFSFFRTDRNGEFDVSGLRAGTYRIGFYTDLEPASREFWDDAATVDGATDIVVATGATSSGHNAQLGTAGHVLGRVTDGSGTAVADVRVDAYVADAGPDGWTRFSSGYTDALGRYDVGDLPAGTYRLGFRDTLDVLADEFWRDQPTLATAKDVVVPAAGTVSGRNAVLDQLGATLGGTLRGADGRAVDGRVVLYRQGGNGRFVRYAEAPTGAWYSYEGLGGFRFGRLPAGSYRLEFDPDDPALTREYWDDAATATSATTVTLAAGQRLSDLDPVLTATGP